MLGSPILYLKGMRILMFQLSGFYCRSLSPRVSCRYGARARDPEMTPWDLWRARGGLLGRRTLRDNLDVDEVWENQGIGLVGFGVESVRAIPSSSISANSNVKSHEPIFKPFLCPSTIAGGCLHSSLLPREVPGSPISPKRITKP